MRWAHALRLLLTVLALCGTGALPAAAEKRVALVIGNNDYPALSAAEQLKRAVNDANAIGDALASLGFEVERGENLSRAQMLSTLLATARDLESGDTGFFFFAGHGVSIDGANYLLPADIPPAAQGAEDLVKLSAISEATVIETLKGRGVRVAVIVIDACRNNPFSQGGTRAFGDATRGLSRPPSVQPQGVFGLYSAGFGEQALDGLGDDDPDPNSIFTRVLAPALREPGQSLLDIAYRVNEEVARLAGTVDHEQNPAYYDQARARDVFLGPREEGGAVSAEPAAPACAQAEAHYEAANRIGTRAALEDHLSRFGSCAFAGLADQLVAALEAEESAVAPGPDNAAAPEPEEIAPPAEAAAVPEAAPAPDNRRGRIGIEIQAITADVAETFGLAEGVGVLVSHVWADSPAARAGIETTDVLVEFDGQAVENLNHLSELVAAAVAGDTVEVVMLRNGERIAGSMTIDRPAVSGEDIAALQPDDGASPAAPESATGDPTPNQLWANEAARECERLTALLDQGFVNPAAVVTACDQAKYKLNTAAALDFNDAEAHYNLGEMFEKGQGVPQDDVQAVSWYTPAVAQDYPDAHWKLGLMYQSGRGGLAENVPQAVHHLMRAFWLRSDQARLELIDNRGALLSSAARRKIQSVLKGIGFYSGALDGEFGQATIDALEGFFASLPP